MSELAAKRLSNAGANPLKIMSRTPLKAQEFASKLGAEAVSCDDRQLHLKSADIVICSTSCAHSLISLEDARQVARARQQKPIVMIDIAVPRNIDSRAGEIDGVYLFNLDSLEEVIRRDARDHKHSADSANKIVADEVAGFRRRLLAERLVPTIVALRQRLEELCHQEVEYLRREFGPFTEEQDEVLTTLASHITQRIAGSLARELRELPDRTGQNMLTVAVHRLFHLENSDAVIEAVQEN
jgi:glutamyl-tRNA reductase